MAKEKSLLGMHGLVSAKPEQPEQYEDEQPQREQKEPNGLAVVAAVGQKYVNIFGDSLVGGVNFRTAQGIGLLPTEHDYYGTGEPRKRGIGKLIAGRLWGRDPDRQRRIRATQDPFTDAVDDTIADAYVVRNDVKAAQEVGVRVLGGLQGVLALERVFDVSQHLPGPVRDSERMLAVDLVQDETEGKTHETGREGWFRTKFVELLSGVVATAGKRATNWTEKTALEELDQDPTIANDGKPIILAEVDRTSVAVAAFMGARGFNPEVVYDKTARVTIEPGGKVALHIGLETNEVSNTAANLLMDKDMPNQLEAVRSVVEDRFGPKKWGDFIRRITAGRKPDVGTLIIGREGAGELVALPTVAFDNSRTQVSRFLRTQRRLEHRLGEIQDNLAIRSDIVHETPEAMVEDVRLKAKNEVKQLPRRTVVEKVGDQIKQSLSAEIAAEKVSFQMHGLPYDMTKAQAREFRNMNNAQRSHFEDLLTRKTGGDREQAIRLFQMMERRARLIESQE